MSYNYYTQYIHYLYCVTYRHKVNLKNYSINFFSLYTDDMQIPSRLLQPNFSKDESLYIDAYHTLLRNWYSLFELG